MPDTQHLIGHLLEGNAERDAVHIAVLPAYAVKSNDISGGDLVRIPFGFPEVDGCIPVLGCNYTGGFSEPIGIVDPFLTYETIGEFEIPEGKKFLVFVQPGLTTGLRHVYHFPQIDQLPAAMSEAEIWLRRFASKWNFNFVELIQNAKSEPPPAEGGHYFGNYITAHGIDLHSRSELGEDHDVFWQKLSEFTQREYSPEHRQKFTWSCSC